MKTLVFHPLHCGKVKRFILTLCLPFTFVSAGHAQEKREKTDAEINREATIELARVKLQRELDAQKKKAEEAEALRIRDLATKTTLTVFQIIEGEGYLAHTKAAVTGGTGRPAKIEKLIFVYGPTAGLVDDDQRTEYLWPAGIYRYTAVNKAGKTVAAYRNKPPPEKK